MGKATSRRAACSLFIGDVDKACSCGLGGLARQEGEGPQRGSRAFGSPPICSKPTRGRRTESGPDAVRPTGLLDTKGYHKNCPVRDGLRQGCRWPRAVVGESSAPQVPGAGGGWAVAPLRGEQAERLTEPWLGLRWIRWSALGVSTAAHDVRSVWHKSILAPISQGITCTGQPPLLVPVN
jgi:hypothetical protein